MTKSKIVLQFTPQFVTPKRYAMISSAIEVGDRNYKACQTQVFISFHWKSEIRAEHMSLFVKNINRSKTHVFNYYSFPQHKLINIQSLEWRFVYYYVNDPKMASVYELV